LREHFITGSASSHEVYLRIWAKETPVLIISVDYVLSPEVQYPHQLEECYHVYKWLLGPNSLGIKPSVLILAGDSAGGNLALTVTFKAIKDGLRVPDGLLLAYPAVDMTTTPTPSRFLFHNDFIVPHPFLKVCRSAYIPEGHDVKDPLLSPLYAPDDLLKKLPRQLYIMSAGIDPLLDDTAKFVQRLKKLGKHVHTYLYEFLPHGFWNFGGMIPAANDAIKDTAKIINRILERSLSEKSKTTTTTNQAFTTRKGEIIMTAY